ncbi:PID-CTERM protein-sorting domain-containing protein [uncultured Mesonia sp.]|uniref:PID-CTERM protein-sorting domain-containing protein n=1 Tax=uncultured Mesonia sp. TaxID=399731 RepID=UPI00374ED722
MRKFILLFSLIVLGSFCSTASAQGLGAIGFASDDVDDETPAAPIDSLLAFGLLAGTAYGIRKIKK